jgi:hypothetical protein
MYKSRVFDDILLILSQSIDSSVTSSDSLVGAFGSCYRSLEKLAAKNNDVSLALFNNLTVIMQFDSVVIPHISTSMSYMFCEVFKNPSYRLLLKFV